ncbi:MAG: ester cyclase [Kofleriaceae bacterium]
MTKLALLVIVMATGCGGKKEPDKAPAPGSAPSADAATSAPKTAEQKAVRYHACWAAWNDGKYEAFATCYTVDATSDAPGSGQPTITGRDRIVAQSKEAKIGLPDQKGTLELELVSGDTIISMVLLTGTHTEPMKGPTGDLPTTSKKVGVRAAVVVNLDPDGAITSESTYLDSLTFLGQLAPSTKKGFEVRAPITAPAPHVIIVAKGDDREKANAAVVATMQAALNKHDIKQAAASLADDVVWSELAGSQDVGKQDLLAGTPGFWKAFPDLTYEVTRTWTAGDYVVVQETLRGTNTGPMPGMGITKPTGKPIEIPALAVFQLSGGKVKAGWLFLQSSAMTNALGIDTGIGVPPT